GVLCLSRKFLARFDHATVGIAAFVIVQSIAFLVGWLAVDALPAWGILLPMLGPEEKWLFYFRMLGISGIVALFFFRYLFVLHQWRRQVEARAAARLEALQARMRPHFLFNSLNAIAGLTRSNPVLAETLIEDLAELMHASMRVDRVKMVALKEEIGLAKLYLNIESHRLDERLKVHWELGDLPMDAMLPPLSLQPVIENAVYHGIERLDEGGEIRILGKAMLGIVTLSVLNTLPSASGRQTERKGNRMAIDNLAARFSGCFQGEAELRMGATDSHYRVDLVFPYRKTEKP
ncbi:MAG: sensor histidine kinase, partial [Gammaproteobacteria bacterium]